MKYSADNDRYMKLEYKRCGNSGIKLPLISLGLWHNFGGVDAFENSKKILLQAFDSGITHFDLANNYGPPFGSAEETIGKILKTDLKPYRDELIISSKAGYIMWQGPYGDWGSKKYLVASINQSLKRMGLGYVDIFYHHRFDPSTPLEETMGALDLIVRQGKALYIGLSNYSAEETINAITILKNLGTPCLIHQPKYSMLYRKIEDDLLNVLNKYGIGCITYSPLAQGILTDKYLDGIPENSRAGNANGFLQPAQVTTEKLEKVRALNKIAKEREQSLAQMAIAWILRKKEITSVLIGPRNINQLDDNLASLNNPTFSEEELNKIDNILSKE